MIPNLSEYISMDTFHRFSFFLGTTEGELLKRFIELILYGIISYMIISELDRNKKREYKYLIVGFLSLFIRQTFMSLILFNQVFSINKFLRFEILIGYFDVYLETISLLLIVSAFVFPAFKKRTDTFQRGIINSFLVISAITLVSYLLLKNSMITLNYGSVILQIVQVFVLITPFYLLTKGDYQKIKYRKTIFLAFFIYLLIPLMRIISYLWTGTINPRLIVAQHPLPFLSILLLTRSVYLTLVDKAFLQTKLRKSEEMVKHEKELNRLKDDFISMVSHELRTPITSIKLYLALLEKEKFGKIGKKQKKAIKTILGENKRLGDLITNLLTLNKIEAKKLVLEKSKFNINEIIDGLYINIAKSKGIKVSNKIKKDPVIGDKNMLKQVYINLMNNAIKFSEKGKIELKSGKKRNKWFFSVKDSGIGIPKSEIPKLFDKFYQVEDTFTRKNPGIGLGLSIVKNIVELHNGSVEIKSEIGKGTEFKIWIPLK